MSTASKVPQNRTFRYAGSTRLPSRLVRPTYRTKDSSANFVSSAQQMQKKKDFDFSGRMTKSVSKTYGDDQEKDVDCNHNEHKSSELNLSLTPDGENIQQQNKKYYKMQQPTVNQTSNVDNTYYQSTSNHVQSNGNDKTEPTASVKLLKPGYFMQKIQALKTSQLQKQSDGSRRKIYNSEELKFSSRPVLRDSNESHKLEDSSSVNEQKRSDDRRFTDPESSKLHVLFQKHSTELPLTIENSTATRGEKRKKYLELPSQSNRANFQKKPQQNNTSALKPPMKLDGRNGYTGSCTSEKRENPKKTLPRTAKIVRPVVRPKKGVKAVITPKPFVSEYSTAEIKPDVKLHARELPLPSVGIYHPCHEDGRKNEQHLQRRLLDKTSSGSANSCSASTNENHYVDSTVHFGFRQGTVENDDDDKLSRAKPIDMKTESCSVADEEVDLISSCCISNGSEVEYLPAEESYKIRETRKTSTSSSDSSGEVRSSPDCEYTSESSVETVISVTGTRSSDGSGKETEECRTDYQYGDTELNYETYTSKISLECLGQSNGVISGNILHTPNSSTLSPLAPSTSSTSKPKKRRTDVRTSPFLFDSEHDSVQQSRSDSEIKPEKKTLFSNEPEDNSDNDEEENNFSELHNLSSLHESALMADYNSITENDYESDVAVDDEHTETNTWDATEKAKTSSKSSTATVINKLLCEGIATVAEDTEQSSVCPANHELIADVSVMNMLLVQLQQTLKSEEAERERQAKENKRLMNSNEKLTKLVGELTEKLNTVTLQKEQAETDAAKRVCMQVEASSQTASEPHKYRSEVSTKVESEIKQAAADMKVIQEIFDGKVRGVVKRLHDAIGVLPK